MTPAMQTGDGIRGSHAQDLCRWTLQRLVGFLGLSDYIRRRGGRGWARYRKCCDAGPRGMPLFNGRSTMSGFGFFNKHRTWEDWFGMLLGVLIVVSPWFPFSSHD